MLIRQLEVDSQAATFSQTSSEAACTAPAPISGSAIPALPAVTVSEARLIRLGWWRR